MSNVQPLRPGLSQPLGRLQLARKPATPDWFDGREVRVSAVAHGANGPTKILLSTSGPSGEYHLPLSAGEAALLMFEIGYALEQAAQGARSH